MRTVWITWERQRRNREVAEALGIPLVEWADLDAYGGRLLKYVIGVARTMRLLLRIRPDIVACQNPSIVLAFSLVLLRSVGRYRLIVDAHNAGLRPCDEHWRVLNFASRLIQRRADLTLVSNNVLKEHVESHGGVAFTLPDRIPSFHPVRATPLPGRSNVVFICSFASDEPYENVLAAASLLQSGTVVHVTGDHSRRHIDPSGLSANVVLTGYLSEDDYVSLLNAADLVMDLTDRADCLVCGAYEALALGKPMVLSDTAANRQYFSLGSVYTAHDPRSLARSIEEALSDRVRLGHEARSLAAVRRREWEGLKAQLLQLMDEWTDTTGSGNAVVSS